MKIQRYRPTWTQVLRNINHSLFDQANVQFDNCTFRKSRDIVERDGDFILPDFVKKDRLWPYQAMPTLIRGYTIRPLYIMVWLTYISYGRLSC